MDLSSISDKLPTYPPKIQGDLRLILQIKDIFMASYHQLEKYRRLSDEQKSLITNEFVREQLQVSEDEIDKLHMELANAENRLRDRIGHNDMLVQHLVNLGFYMIEHNPPARPTAVIRYPQNRKRFLTQKRICSEPYSGNDCLSKTHLIDSIAVELDEIRREVKNRVKPLIDYYQDLFYLQLHFSTVLGKVCNYCMPLVTKKISFLERVFWTERPESENIRSSSDISDRLKKIYNQSQQIYHVLSDSVQFLQSKVDLQKSLAERFHERIDKQQKTKEKILRDIHNAKMSIDSLEEENDRLVGRLVKLDPSFVDSRNFAEHGIKTFTMFRKAINSPPTEPNARGDQAIASCSNYGNLNVLSATSERIKKHDKHRKTDDEAKRNVKHSKKRVQSIETRVRSRDRDQKGLDLSSGEEDKSQTLSSKRNSYLTPFNTESENPRPQSELVNSGEKRSLRSHLLARTRGMLDLRRLHRRDGEDSSGSGALNKSEYPERGDSTHATFSPLHNRMQPDSVVKEVLRDNQIQRGRTQGQHQRVCAMKKRSKYPREARQNLALEGENMLLVKETSRARLLKSKERGRRNGLTCYLTNSASNSLSSIEC